MKLANEKLIQVNQKVLKTYKAGQSRPGTGRDEVPSLTQKAVYLSRMVVKIQAWLRRIQTRKMLEIRIKMIEQANNTIKTTDDKDKELFKCLNDALKAKGLTLEALYKLCDSQEKQIISHNEFAEWTKKLKLPLKEAQIKRFMMIIDEDCTGYIKYHEYEQTLEAYGYPSEKYKTSSYGRECMGKMYGVLLRRSIKIQEMCAMCEEDNSSKIKIQNIARILAGLNAGLYKREIRAITRYLDPEGTDSIGKEEFMAMLKAGEEPWRQANQKPIMAWTQETTAFTNTGLRRSLLVIVEKMESTGISLEEFVNSFGDQPLISLGKVINKLSYCYPELTKDEKITFGKCIPLTEGFVNLHELLVFLRGFSAEQRERPVNVYFQFWTNNLKGALGMTPADYFRREEIKDEIDRYTFMEKARATVGLGEIIYKMMWKSMIQYNENTVPLDDLLTVLESYLNISGQKELAARTDFKKVLENHSMKLDDIFKIAHVDIADGQDKVPSICILRSFKKITPEIDPQLIRTRLKEKGITDLITGLDFNSFKEIFGTNEIQESPRKPSRDPLYWINKLDNVMLELGLSPTAMFRKADTNNSNAVTIQELNELLKEVFPQDKITSSDLFEIMKAMDLNRNGVIEFDEFVSIFKNARSATASYTNKKSTQRLPVYGNPIFINLEDESEKEETEVITVKNLLNKIEVNNFSFAEFVEVLQWSGEGEIRTSDFIKSMEEYFGSTLTSEELEMLAQEIDKEKEKIEVKDLLQFFDANIKNEDEDQKLVNLDLLIMVLAFKKSKRSTVTEFFKLFELTPTLKLSQTPLTNLLMDNFGYSRKSAGRLVRHFQEKSTNPNSIPVQVIINELEEYIQQTQVVPLVLEADDQEKVRACSLISRQTKSLWTWLIT